MTLHRLPLRLVLADLEHAEKALAQVVDEALARDPEERIESIEELAGRLAPFGTDAARASYARIQRVAAHASAPSESMPEEGADAPVAVPRQTAPGRVTEVAATAGETPRARRAWAFPAALGIVLAGAVGLGVGFARHKGAEAAAPAAAACPDGPTAACKAACDGGDLKACNALGAFYATGDRVAKDPDEAVRRYTLACNGGLARGCVNLGAMYFDVKSDLHNDDLATRFFSQGCSGGDPLGCLNMSVACQRGRGVAKNPRKAVDFATRACKEGVGAGCARVAEAKVTGEGVAKDVDGGLRELDALCEKKEVAGCETLMTIYTMGVGTDVAAAPSLVNDYGKKACDLGSALGCAGHGIENRLNQSDNVVAQGVASFAKQCERGVMSSCGMWGNALKQGLGVPKNEAEGDAKLLQACNGGVKWACGGKGDAGR